ncbi:MAG: hypothetical protein KKC85_17050 [Gammaproteobacteria bacterium]|nr:hypothetical protein [Gammaproteobacteria bacterium]MBU1443994.1 hypothetical protein [Gammaproteobacteria bacterium]MBU2288123.1 hypothetical protein [Gammaproteobacteria bacterium]
MNNITALVGILAVFAILAGAHVIDALSLEQLAIGVGNLLTIICEYTGITWSQSVWIAVSALCLWYWGAQK